MIKVARPPTVLRKLQRQMNMDASVAKYAGSKNAVISSRASESHA
jgi:hypothetical protein